MKEAELRQGHILVIDDMPASLEVLMTILSERGYRVYPATDGQEGLTSIRDFLPDLILLDISLPDIDGYELCRRLKEDENERVRNIPILFIWVSFYMYKTTLTQILSTR